MAISVVSFPFSRCSTGGPQAQLSAGWWLSLLHLITNLSGPQTPSGYPRAPSAGCGFPDHTLSSNSSSLQLQLWLLSWLSYIIVQRPLSHLLDLWNRMFNRHQAEITVMQFTGHSLPVHQSMSVPWEFFTSSYFISQFPPTRFPFITAIRMCHFLPVHHLGMAFLAGSKVKIQHYLLIGFFSLFWNVLFCLKCLTLSRSLLSHPTSVNIFWFISSCIIRFVVLFWSLHHKLSSCVFPSLALSIVPISLPVFIA